MLAVKIMQWFAAVVRLLTITLRGRNFLYLSMYVQSGFPNIIDYLEQRLNNYYVNSVTYILKLESVITNLVYISDQYSKISWELEQRIWTWDDYDSSVRSYHASLRNREVELRYGYRLTPLPPIPLMPISLRPK